MTQDFTEQFIDTSHIGFASDMFTELGFNHPHGRLDIRPLVIVTDFMCKANVSSNAESYFVTSLKRTC